MKPMFTKAFLSLLLFMSTLLFIPSYLFAQCGSLAATVTPNESRCAATGSIVINASGGISPEVYQYSITSGPVTTGFSSVSTFSGLPPGTYSVLIKDVTANCTITKSNIIVPGNYTAPRIFYNSTDPVCMNGNDGTIFVTSQTGGRAPFSYQIISPSPSKVGTISSNGTFTGLKAGLYYIQMTDSCGGIQTRTQLINNYSWSIANVDVNNTCQHINVNISLTNSNGINSPNSVYSGFQYGITLTPGDTTWFSSASFSFDIGMFRGAHIVVKDNCGNLQSYHWTEQTPSVNANISTSNKTCITYTATVTGQQNIDPSAVQYCLYDATNTILLASCQTSPVFPGLSYGTTYTVRINETCFDTTILRTFSATKPAPSIDANPQYGYSCTSFSAAITGQKDTSNASYCLYSNGNASPDTCNTTGLFDSLTYGVPYCIQMHNADACFDTIITRCFSVGKPIPDVSASVSISNQTCTSFTAKITGQTNLTNPIYQLFDGTNNTQIGPDQTSSTFNSLPYGSYCIHIINDSACYDTTIVLCFTRLAASVTDISLSSKGSCSQLGTTNIKVSFNSGIDPFTSKIYAPDGTLLGTSTTTNSSYTFNFLPALPAGQFYKVVTTDSCGQQDSGLIGSNIYYINRGITVTPRCPSGTSPNGTSDVKIIVTENRGGTFATTIIKKDGATFNQGPDITLNSGNTHSFTFSSLWPATYIFDTYSQNCNTHVYDTVEVLYYFYPSLAYSSGYICDDGTQSIGAVTSGGLPPYQFQIIGSVPATPDITTGYQSTPVFNINNGTPYSVIRLRVLDACSNASINDVGFISVATPVINVNSICPVAPTALWVDPVANATYLWYKRTYDPYDSVLVDSGSAHLISSLTPADTGTYISETIVNGGCEIRISSFNLISDSMACSIVPVRLKNLSAVKKDDHALLSWSISNEISLKNFYIERSIDNGKTWQPVGEVDAGINKSDYLFTDEDPQKGINMYRLKMINENGIISYSNIVHVEIEVTNSIVVYPNPLGKAQLLHTQLAGFDPGSYKIRMISSYGQIIKELPVEITNERSALLKISTVDLASGNYEITIYGSGHQYYSKPIVIMNR